MTATTSFRYADAPVLTDRTDGFRYIAEFGEVFQAEDGTWVLTSLEAVRFAQRNPEIFCSGRAYQAGLPVPLVPVGVDPPDHAKYRRVLDPMLAPRVINAVEDELRAQVRDLIVPLVERGSCDVVADIANLFPTQVFLTMFGLPLSHRDQLIEWVATVNENSTGAGTAEPSPTVVEAALAMFGFLQGCIEDKKRNPGNDMLSQILALDGDDAWSDDEVIGLCWLITLAGLDTVMAAIGFTMLHLAQQPQLRQQVIADAECVTQVIEEVLRLEPPAPMNSRVTTQEVTLCGVTIPADSPVMLCLATANRGDSRDSPHDIDLEQSDRGHLTFGGGIHRCLGSHLARRELRLVVEEFHKLIPDYEIAPGHEPKVVWPSGTLHLKTLPLIFPSAGRTS
jgi:cytochrome P450